MKHSKIVLVENNEIITDNKKNAEIMNNYFVNITQNLNIPESILEKIPRNTDVECLDPIDQILLNYSKHPSILKIKVFVKPIDTFSFNKADEKEIEKEILELSSNKSAGPDAIPPRVIKDSVSVLKSPLTQLFNTSVEDKHFPSDLKYANIAPLYKKDDNTDKSNYRPISILPSISKIFGRLRFKQITTYISNLLSPYLCGFGKGYSAQHILLRLTNKMNKCLDKKECVGLFMMDLSKAFDCIPHELMIAKLHAYSFGKKSLKLVYSYLKGRNQRVRINTEYSSWKQILSGVPQGSALGPLLFNMFLNDLFLFVEESDVYNYADDNSLSVADICIHKIITKLESDIKTLETWFKNNGMVLNEGKCQIMIIEPSNISRNNKAKIYRRN